jgi:hypothetical protein
LRGKIKAESKKKAEEAEAKNPRAEKRIESKQPFKISRNRLTKKQFLVNPH